MLPQLTETELTILQLMWERSEITCREIAESIYDEVNDPKIATVQKLLERLEAKGCVQRDRSRRAHRFRATVSRALFLQHKLQSLADRLCGGSVAPLMSTLLRSPEVSQKDSGELRQLIERLWPESFDKKEGRQ